MIKPMGSLRSFFAAHASPRTLAVGVTKVGVQVVVLWVIFALSNAVVADHELGIPGNIVGFVLLFVLLGSGIVKERWVSAGAALLTRHLAFFFIPITVGLMGLKDIFAAHGAAIVITLVISAALGICVAGLSSQALAARRRRRTA
jgi:holin-like protein